MKRGLAMLAAALALVGGAADGHTISPVVVTDLDGHDIAVPANLPGGRTLIILGFHHADQAIVAAWKTGLGLAAGTPNWLEIPVIGVSSTMIRGMIRSGMRGTYHAAAERAHVAPAFGDAAALARGFGVTPDRVAVIVVDHDGRVIAEAAGAYSANAATPLLAAWHGGD